MLEHSTSLAGVTPLTESGKRDLEETAGLLALASKRIRCSPTTESDSYGERDSQKATDKERDRERENKLKRDRA